MFWLSFYTTSLSCTYRPLMISLKRFRFSEKKFSGFRGHFYKAAAGHDGFFLLKKKALTCSYLLITNSVSVCCPNPKWKRSLLIQGCFTNHKSKNFHLLISHNISFLSSYLIGCRFILSSVVRWDTPLLGLDELFLPAYSEWIPRCAHAAHYNWSFLNPSKQNDIFLFLCHPSLDSMLEDGWVDRATTSS